MSLFTFITLIITCIIINIGLVFSLNNKGKSQLKTLSSLIFILLIASVMSLVSSILETFVFPSLLKLVVKIFI